MINVVIISNDTEIKQLLTEQDDMRVFVIAETALDDTVQNIKACTPDIIVMEQHLEKIDVGILCYFLGLSSNCSLASNLILTEDVPTVEMLQDAGFRVQGYIIPEQRRAIAKAVRVVFNGEAWLSRQLVSDVIDHFSSLYTGID